MRILFIALALINVLGCAADNFPKYELLGSLRVLAMVADNGGKAEANPGDTFNITPYVSDINDSGNVTASAVACIDPGIGVGAEPTCVADPNAVTLAPPSWVAPMTDFTGSFAVTIPNSILLGQSTQNQFNGVNYIVIYTVSGPSGTVTSVKRIPVSSKATKNSNPGAPQILSNGAPLGLLTPSSVSALTAVPAGGAQESYQYMDVNGNVLNEVETLTTTWFISDGSLDIVRTDLVNTIANYTAPDTFPTTRNSFIVSVQRDNRGGETVVKTIIH